MRETSELFKPEDSKFKERTTQHLKRPALVTVKKPLLQPAEMEDVLVRLLKLEVPPVIPEDKRTYYDSRIGRIRAIVIGRGKAGSNYRIRDMILEGVEVTPETFLNSVGIVHTSENIVVNENKTQEDSGGQYYKLNEESKKILDIDSSVIDKQKLTAKAEDILGISDDAYKTLNDAQKGKLNKKSFWGQTLDTALSALEPLPFKAARMATKIGLRTIKTPLSESIERSADARASYILPYATYMAQKPEIRALLDKNRVDLYLFYDSDAKALLFGSDKDSIARFEAKSGLEGPKSNKIIPTDSHSPLIFYDNTKDVSDESEIQVAKNGSILRPKYVDTLYITSYDDYIKNEKDNPNVKLKIKANMATPGQEPTTFEIQQILKQAVWGVEACKKHKYKATLHHFVCLMRPQHTWTISNQGITNDAIYTQAKTIVKTHYKELKDLCEWIHTVQGWIQRDEIESFQFNINKDCDPIKVVIPMLNKVVSGSESWENLVKCVNALASECTTYYQQYYNKWKNTSARPVLGPYTSPRLIEKAGVDLMLWTATIESEYKSGYRVQDNITRLPMLPTDLNTAYIESEQKRISALLDVSITNLTTNSASNASFGSFTTKYYSVLLKKIEAKYNNMKEFFDKGMIVFPYINEYTEALKYLNNVPGMLRSTTYNPASATFLAAMDTLLFGPHSGFYITSKSQEDVAPVAPMVNAEATKPSDFVRNTADTFTNILKGELDDAAVDAMTDVIYYRLLATKNDDVMSINIARSTAASTESTCVIQLKNYDKKYNYTSSQLYDHLKNTDIKAGVATADKSDNIFDPLDVVTVYLPNKDNQLEVVYTGVISKIQAENRGGYNQLSLNCTCQKRLLDLSRTNTKPSFSRDESLNEQVVAFSVIPEFLKDMSLWMPYIATPALSYMLCQPKRITVKEFNKKLFEMKDTAILRPLTIEEKDKAKEVKVKNIKNDLLHKKDIVDQVAKASTAKDKFVSQVKEAGNITGVLENRNVNLTTGAQLISTDETLEQPITYEELVNLGVAEVHTPDKTLVESTIHYKQVQFFDPLYNYLWYKTNTRHTVTDDYIIGTALTQLLNEYVDTTVLGTSADPGIKIKSHGIYNVSKLLREGERGAYIIYKQRHDTVMYESYFNVTNETMTCTFPREAVLKFVGTSQPIYQLQSGKAEIQFSAWKTNAEIFKEIANKYDYVFFADKYGVLLFSPINMDLSSLATNHYTDTSLPNKILEDTLPSHYLESLDNNYQILKTKDVIDYKRIKDERKILNWIPLSGQLGMGGNIGNMIHAQVQDPRLIGKLGVRAAKNVTVLGCQNQEALQYYGICWMDRNNKRYLACDVSGLFYADMDINVPYYAHFDNTIYYAESLNISYRPGSTCTYTLGGTFGRRPILSLKKDDTSGLKPKSVIRDYTSLKTALVNLLKNNEITPSVYAQYSVILERVHQCDEILKKMDIYTQLNQTIENFKDSLKELTNTKGLLKDLIGGIKDTLRDLGTTIVSKQALINELETLRNTYIAEDLRLKEALAEAMAEGDAAEIARLEAEIEANLENINDVTARLLLLEDDVRGLNQKVASNETELNKANDDLWMTNGAIDKTTQELKLDEVEEKDQLTELQNLVKKCGFGALSGKIGKDKAAVEKIRNSFLAIICYNGYIWDNISGISFEELPYYAAYLYGVDRAHGFEAAVLGVDRNKQLPVLQKLMDKKKTQADEQVKAATELYTRDLIALSGARLLEQKNNILKKNIQNSDLLVSPLVHDNAATESTGEQIRIVE